MKIQKNHVVTLHYKLHEDDAQGELIEETYNAEPLSFIFGMGMMLPAFEENLEGNQQGGTFAFTLQPEDAYGDYDDNAVVDIPLDRFANENGEIDRTVILPGAPLTFNDQDGRAFHGVVQEVKTENVIVDFNHPMSGHILHFIGEILEVRPATNTELAHGHVHPGGHDHD